MRYCYLISNFCMRCDSWIYKVWDMNVDSKILYEIWLLSVWNKKSDDCMRYDNAPFCDHDYFCFIWIPLKLKCCQFQLFLTELGLTGCFNCTLFKVCNLLKGYCRFSKVRFGTKKMKWVVLLCYIVFCSGKTYNIDCFRPLRTLGIWRKKGLTA